MDNETREILKRAEGIRAEEQKCIDRAKLFRNHPDVKEVVRKAKEEWLPAIQAAAKD